jgi:hypothetical protein
VVRETQGQTTSMRPAPESLAPLPSHAIGNDLDYAATFGYLFIMTETETSLLQALLDLEHSVTEMRTAHSKPNLLPLFERIDQLTRQLPRNGDPQLLHYLHKKSYEKARLFLQGREAENVAGNGGHL